jgi:hypothetical protein
LRIADLGFKKKQKTEIILWERLLAAILRFQRFTAYCAKRPEPACPEFIEWVEGLTAYY